MPEMPERGQSPPPERSSGKQMHDVPASGKGTDDASHKEDINKEALEVRRGPPPEQALRSADSSVLLHSAASDIQPPGPDGGRGRAEVCKDS
jgi:hypothetical protein